MHARKIKIELNQPAIKPAPENRVHQPLKLLEEKYVANSAKVGQFLRAKLEKLQERYQVILNVRGRGLMIGVQMATPQIRDTVIEECFRRGLLILGAGPSTIRISPPLIIDEEQAAIAAEMFESALPT